MAKIQNTAKGGRGFGVDGVGIEWAPGEIKDVDDAVVAAAMKDPTSAALFDDGGGLVILGERRMPTGLTNPSGSPEDIAKIEAAVAQQDAANVEAPVETPETKVAKGAKK